jgi:glycosyltransferase involved in cell wall biosynthesis
MGASWIPEEFVNGLFSVIVATRNRAHTILETLDSVKAQTYRPIEIIIVDGASTDNTPQIVQEWTDENAERDLLSVQYCDQLGTGFGGARNEALQHSRGEYIQILDSDDLIHPQRFEKAAEIFKKTSADYIETGFEGFVERIGDLKEIHYGHEDSDLLGLLCRGRLWPNTIRNVYRRRLMQRTGPWNDWMKTVSDYEYAIRSLAQNPKTKTASIGDVLTYARRHQGERLSELIKTRIGREERIYSEALLCDLVKKCDYIPYKQKQELASRIYALGFRSNASGWADLGKRCGEIAAGLGVDLDMKGKLRKLAWRGGRMGGLIYLAFGKLKRIL